MKARRKPAPLVRLVRGSGLGDIAEPDDVTGDVSWPRPVPVRADQIEFASQSFDPSLQLVGSDPQRSQAWGGIVVPSAPTTDPSLRYLFLLTWLSVPHNVRGKITGLRTSLRLGALVPGAPSGSYPVEHEIEDPFWKSPLGNACFFLRRMPLGLPTPYNPLTSPGVSFLHANTPSLIFQTLAPYAPPNAGMPPGVDLVPAWYDNRFGPWRSDQPQESVDYNVFGPCEIGLYCSLQQMPASKITPALSAGGLSDTDVFLQQNPTAQFARVAGAITWKEVTGS